MRYELYYWPSIQGRGDFVRLVLEEAAVPYIDVARLPKARGGGVPAMMKLLRGDVQGAPRRSPRGASRWAIWSSHRPPTSCSS